MFSVKDLVRQGAATFVITATVFQPIPAHADGEFPFGLEMTLDVARQGGSKRLPTMEIGDNGEAVLELWCKAGKGQFSVAGNTVIFVAGRLEDHACAPAGGGAGADLVAALGEGATRERHGEFVSFFGGQHPRLR